MRKEGVYCALNLTQSIYFGCSLILSWNYRLLTVSISFASPNDVHLNYRKNYVQKKLTALAKIWASERWGFHSRALHSHLLFLGTFFVITLGEFKSMNANPFLLLSQRKTWNHYYYKFKFHPQYRVNEVGYSKGRLIHCAKYDVRPRENYVQNVMSWWKHTSDNKHE